MSPTQHHQSRGHDLEGPLTFPAAPASKIEVVAGSARGYLRLLTLRQFRDTMREYRKSYYAGEVTEAQAKSVRAFFEIYRRGRLHDAFMANRERSFWSAKWLRSDVIVRGLAKHVAPALLTQGLSLPASLGFELDEIFQRVRAQESPNAVGSPGSLHKEVSEKRSVQASDREKALISSFKKLSDRNLAALVRLLGLARPAASAEETSGSHSAIPESTYAHLTYHLKSVLAECDRESLEGNAVPASVASQASGIDGAGLMRGAVELCSTVFSVSLGVYLLSAGVLTRTTAHDHLFFSLGDLVRENNRVWRDVANLFPPLLHFESSSFTERATDEGRKAHHTGLSLDQLFDGDEVLWEYHGVEEDGLLASSSFFQFTSGPGWGPPGSVGSWNIHDETSFVETSQNNPTGLEKLPVSRFDVWSGYTPARINFSQEVAQKKIPVAVASDLPSLSELLLNPSPRLFEDTQGVELIEPLEVFLLDTEEPTVLLYSGEELTAESRLVVSEKLAHLLDISSPLVLFSRNAASARVTDPHALATLLKEREELGKRSVPLDIPIIPKRETTGERFPLPFTFQGLYRLSPSVYVGKPAILDRGSDQVLVAGTASEILSRDEGLQMIINFPSPLTEELKEKRHLQAAVDEPSMGSLGYFVRTIPEGEASPGQVPTLVRTSGGEEFFLDVRDESFQSVEVIEASNLGAIERNLGERLESEGRVGIGFFPASGERRLDHMSVPIPIFSNPEIKPRIEVFYTDRGLFALLKGETSLLVRMHDRSVGARLLWKERGPAVKAFVVVSYPKEVFSESLQLVPSRTDGDNNPQSLGEFLLAHEEFRSLQRSSSGELSLDKIEKIREMGREIFPLRRAVVTELPLLEAHPEDPLVSLESDTLKDSASLTLQQVGYQRDFMDAEIAKVEKSLAPAFGKYLKELRPRVEEAQNLEEHLAIIDEVTATVSLLNGDAETPDSLAVFDARTVSERLNDVTQRLSQSGSDRFVVPEGGLNLTIASLLRFAGYRTYLYDHFASKDGKLRVKELSTSVAIELVDEHGSRKTVVTSATDIRLPSPHSQGGSSLLPFLTKAVGALMLSAAAYQGWTHRKDLLRLAKRRQLLSHLKTLSPEGQEFVNFLTHLEWIPAEAVANSFHRFGEKSFRRKLGVSPPTPHSLLTKLDHTKTPYPEAVAEFRRLFENERFAEILAGSLNYLGDAKKRSEIETLSTITHIWEEYQGLP